jgi:hypothetical protein
MFLKRMQLPHAGDMKLSLVCCLAAKSFLLLSGVRADPQVKAYPKTPY